ncbi:CBS domain-containing protein [Candidatus Entotheonella palauensis]|uniref:CBS domain-containing protein n=1 Tax=Candidatus Entotheonella gemina TaxID=1429439 RepID=W4MAG6_9BACT|nr:CBS domain-containing protein [Candidatus Entotheonella palauensis]ETX06891.1 MAG: hypothetical protein ETSY2_14520 [Candidatus Entotheonella gemina]
MKVIELMSTDVITVNQHDDLRLVDDIMAERRIRHIPVVEAGTLVGLVTHCDMCKAQMSSVMAYCDMSQRAFLHTISVQDIMTHPVVTIAPEASVTEAVSLILDQGIGCLPVMQQNRLIGIVTKTDLLEFLRALNSSEGPFKSHSDKQQVQSEYETHLDPLLSALVQDAYQPSALDLHYLNF